MALSESRMAALLQPYTVEAFLSREALGLLQAYFDLIMKWNAHTNLTAIRDPEELVQRQIGESLFAARLVPESGSLLDFGSGAGFPGIPLQIARPHLKVTLAESQGKKAGFLREVVRTLSLPSEVWAKRVEQMPAARTFNVVTMRAVDATPEMLPLAAARVQQGGSLLRFTAGNSQAGLPGWRAAADLAVPASAGRLLRFVRE